MTKQIQEMLNIVKEVQKLLIHFKPLMEESL